MQGEARPEEELQFITVPESSLPSGLPPQGYNPAAPGGGAAPPAADNDPMAFIKQTRVSWHQAWP
jgi:hypothetical protein